MLRLLRNLLPRNTSLKDPDQWFLDWLTGAMSQAAGVTVTPLTVLGVPTVFACCNRIAGSISSVPFEIYRRTGAGKTRATEHPLYSILHNAPNEEMSSVDFRRSMQFQLSLRRKAFAVIERDGMGRVRALWPVDPSLAVIRRDAETKAIYYEIDRKRYEADQVLYLRGTTSNGLSALDPLVLARDAIGLAVALQDNAARFFSNGSRPGAILTHPNRLTDDVAKRIRTSFENIYKGNKNAYRTAVLEEGMQYIAQRNTNEESQMVEQRKHQDIQLCQLFEMPPHKVGILDKASFSNIEHQSIEYVTDTVLPQARIWEQSINRMLLSPREQREYFVELNLEGLIRGDIKTRYEAYALGRNWGWFNVDEIRSMENLNPLPDGKGQIYLQPLNMQEAGSPAPASVEPTPAQVNELAQRVALTARNHQPLLNGHAKYQDRFHIAF